MPPLVSNQELNLHPLNWKVKSFFKKYIYLFIYLAVLGLWAPLIARLVKNLPAMQEMPVRFLGREDPLEKG